MAAREIVDAGAHFEIPGTRAHEHRRPSDVEEFRDGGGKAVRTLAGGASRGFQFAEHRGRPSLLTCNKDGEWRPGHPSPVGGRNKHHLTCAAVVIPDKGRSELAIECVMTVCREWSSDKREMLTWWVRVG